jgi:hypothetical protein
VATRKKDQGPNKLSDTFFGEMRFWADYLKHLSTLSTGSILLIATFLEKLTPHPNWRGAVTVSIIGFLATVVGSVIAMTAFGLDEANLLSDYPAVFAAWIDALFLIGFILTWLGFCVGVCSLALFTIKNLPN